MLYPLPVRSATASRFKKGLLTLACLSSVTLLSACGGGGGSDDSGAVDNDASTPEETFITNFTLNVSDAPVDNASEVVVYFSEVELVGDGEPVVIDVTDPSGSPRMFDLLELQGEKFANLVDEVEIPSGEYSQLRLVIDEDSFVVMDDGTYPLEVPSQKLKLDGFEAQPETSQIFTVEFDLRKSLVNPQGQDAVFLKPRGVRLVSNDAVGTLSGSVPMSLITDEACSVKADADSGNAVYLYEGSELDPALLGDDADAESDEIRPLSVANVVYDETAGTYDFEIGYVPAGDYTVAFSCLAYQDEPETDENFEFQAVEKTQVSVGETTEVTFN